MEMKGVAFSLPWNLFFSKLCCFFYKVFTERICEFAGYSLIISLLEALFYSICNIFPIFWIIFLISLSVFMANLQVVI